MSNISSDFSKVNPKLGPVIPPYNAQKDIYVQKYFKFKGVKDTLKHTKQVSDIYLTFFRKNVLTCYENSLKHLLPS